MAYLAEQWPDHHLAQDGGQVVVVLPEFQLPAGFHPQVTELLLLIPFGYPDTPLDMFWVDPPVTLHGTAPQATSPEMQLGRQWQRFSRHLPQGAWETGIDDLRSYVALVRTMLEREAGPAALAA